MNYSKTVTTTMLQTLGKKGYPLKTKDIGDDAIQTEVPTYQQVLDWLEKKGIYVSVYIEELGGVHSEENIPYWTYSAEKFYSTSGQMLQLAYGRNVSTNREEAYNQAMVKVLNSIY